MRRLVLFMALASLMPATFAWDAPKYSGFMKVWQDAFKGPAGKLPDTTRWNIITGYLNVNRELEIYTNSNANLQRSGGETLQIVPFRNSSAKYGWTSGRVESRHVITPVAGRRTRVEAQIRFGVNPIVNKQGMWPAFWMLGDILRHGGSWPSCGEVDILETVNGLLRGYGTAHCNVYPGGICNEGAGIGGSTTIPDQGWHTWRVEFDRTASKWQSETVTWYMDGKQFHQVSGSRIGNKNVWASLAHSGLYVILNMAVGGSWPGYPNGATLDGYGSMMEVAYVAHYTT